MLGDGHRGGRRGSGSVSWIGCLCEKSFFSLVIRSARSCFGIFLPKCRTDVRPRRNISTLFGIISGFDSWNASLRRSMIGFVVVQKFVVSRQNQSETMGKYFLTWMGWSVDSFLGCF